MRAPFAFLALTLTVALGLTGCGGGTSSSTPTSPSPTPGGSSASVSAAAIADLTNTERARAGVGTLTMNAKLTTAAQLQADQIASLQVLEHDVPAGRYPTPADRLAAAGYTWQAYGENLASGYTNAADATVGWMNSPGHRDNILNATFTEIGTAYATDSTGRPYYVEVFGRPR